MMTSEKAAIDVVIGSFIEPDLVERIRCAGEDLRVHYRPDLLPVPRYRCDHSAPARDLSPAQLDEWRATSALADIFFDFDWFEPSTMTERAPDLRWIQATSAGIGAVMQRTGLDQKSLLVTTAAGIHVAPLAEFALMGALHFVKGVPDLQARQREHHWERYTTRELKGSRALVVGLGHVGREVVRDFASLGVDVTGLGRSGVAYDVPGLSRSIDRDALEATLATTDIVILAAPLTEETTNLIGAHQLQQLPSHAVLVNVGRGQLVDEVALVDALVSGALAGACVDVFREEPLPAASPLWDLENVIVSPHSASTVATENRDLVELFLVNLDRWRRGESLRNLYDVRKGY
jgi:phosphoglycerate dehydrogenase-like enzyme